MEIVNRQKLAVIALLLIIEKERKRNKFKRIWARHWLQRRNTSQTTLTMRHKELRFVSV